MIMLYMYNIHIYVCARVSLDVVAKSVGRKFPVHKVRDSNPNQIKPVTYKLDTCFCHLVLLG